MDEVSGLVNFDLAKLAEIDGGRIAQCFKIELQRVVEDIENRPADDRERSINLKLTVLPDTGESDGLLDGAKMRCQVTSKLPTYRSKTYDFGVRDGKLRYQPMSPTDHNRPALPGFESTDSEE